MNAKITVLAALLFGADRFAFEADCFTQAGELEAFLIELGALAGGGKGAAIGAGVGAGAGAGSETITKGDQVRVPSETLIEFTLQQDVSIPNRN